MASLAVVACSGCKRPWTVELRSRTASCPGCGKRVDLDRRTRLWEGTDAREARSAAASLRAALAQGVPVEVANRRLRDADPEPVVRHDSPVDAAAAQARAITNQSDRADEVAAWLTRLLGPTDHDTFVAALEKAGLSRERAEREIVRMLACDVVYEPRAGSYASLSS